jgi:hypothetical protein
MQGTKSKGGYMKLIVNLINGKATLCGMGGVEILFCSISEVQILFVIGLTSNLTLSACL